MKTLILHYMLHRKKVMAIGIILACYIGLLTAIAITSDTSLDRLLYPNETFLYFDKVSKQVMGVVITSLLATIAFDFNAPYDEPLYAYFSKPKIVRTKLIVYIGMLILLSVLVNVLRNSIGIILYQTMNISTLITSFTVVYDMILLFFIMLLITPKKYRQISFLIVALYILITMLLEDATEISLYYMIPFYHPIFSMYHLSFIYHILYGFFMMILVYLKETNLS